MNHRRLPLQSQNCKKDSPLKKCRKAVKEQTIVQLCTSTATVQNIANDVG